MRHIYSITIFCCILLLLSSCKNEKKEPYSASVDSSLVENMDDSIVNVTSIAQDDSAMIVASAREDQFLSSRWKYLQLIDYGIEDVDSSYQPFVPDADFFKTYHSVLQWNKQKDFVLDLNSSNLMAVENQTTHQQELQGSDPETLIRLIDVKNHRQRKLIYTGPSTKIMYGKWISGDEVALMGTFPNNDPNKYDTLMYIWNVKTNFTRTYKWIK